VRRAWFIVPAVALAFLFATTWLRVRRVEYVSDSAGPPSEAASSLHGKAPWKPRLIVPGHRDESYEWLDQAGAMIARRQIRLRHVDYENAPAGREVFSASPYRWWLGLVAAWRHASTGARLGPALEWAALYADPLLLLLLGGATTVLVFRVFGPVAAALVSGGLVLLFPFGAHFLPGMPDDSGLAQFLILWSLLPLAAGTQAGAVPCRRRWFAAAGVLGGGGLWVNAPAEAPILAGACAGALLLAWADRRSARGGPSTEAPPWRLWGACGAAASLAAYLLEFFPSHLGSWELHVNHPAFGLAWLGGAEIVARLDGVIARRGPRFGPKAWGACLAGLVPIAAVPFILWYTKSLGFLTAELPAMRLSPIPDGPAAPTFWDWLLQNGFTGAVGTALLPLVAVIPALWLLWTRLTSDRGRAAIALLLGPVAVAVAMTYREIGWWAGADAAVLALVAASASASRQLARQGLVAACAGATAALILLPGAWELWPRSDIHIREGLSESEVETLVERDMARWLANRTAATSAVVLATPNLTTSCYYYGGLKGLSTFGWEDFEGFQSAVRILSATTPEEAQELIGIHGVTHIIIPSWDPFMDAYAQVGAGQLGGTFLERLHQWNLPRWLTPVAYLVPGISGFEGQSAIVLEVVDEQDDATALARIAEYFVDMNQLSLATKAGAGLRRFPADLGALVARAQVENATGDADAFANSVDALVRRIGAGADKDLGWDQRLTLCVLLVQSRHTDLALPRLRQCLSETDEAKLRSLTTVLLYRLQVMRKAFGLEFPSQSLHSLSLELLPPDLRGRVE
jgi:hypothetical protein